MHRKGKGKWEVATDKRHGQCVPRYKKARKNVWRVWSMRTEGKFGGKAGAEQKPNLRHQSGRPDGENLLSFPLQLVPWRGDAERKSVVGFLTS